MRLPLTMPVVLALASIATAQTTRPARSPKPHDARDFVRDVNKLCAKYTNVIKAKAKGDALDLGCSYSAEMRAKSQSTEESINTPEGSTSKHFSHKVIMDSTALLAVEYKLEFTPEHVTTSQPAQGKEGDSAYIVDGEWRPIQRPWQDYVSKLDQDSNRTPVAHADLQARAERYKASAEKIRIICMVPAKLVTKDKIVNSKTLSVTGTITDFSAAGRVCWGARQVEDVRGWHPRVGSLTMTVREIDNK